MRNGRHSRHPLAGLPVDWGVCVEKSIVVADVCKALLEGDRDTARTFLASNYAFAPHAPTSRRYGPRQATRVFIRDGFVDRYTGSRLIFPPVLRLISAELPQDFPYHPNWKTDKTHPAYWELSATIDHLVPVTRGGADDESNWVTTSMARNSAKLNRTLTELGWTLHACGDIKEWDGLAGWFLRYGEQHPDAVRGQLQQWYRAAAAELSA